MMLWGMDKGAGKLAEFCPWSEQAAGHSRQRSIVGTQRKEAGTPASRRGNQPSLVPPMKDTWGMGDRCR